MFQTTNQPVLEIARILETSIPGKSPVDRSLIDGDISTGKKYPMINPGLEYNWYDKILYDNLPSYYLP